MATISDKHAHALSMHLGDILGRDPETARAVIVHMAGESPAYGELRAVDIGAVSEALRDASITVPAIKRGQIASLFTTLREGMPVCETCGRLPVRLDDGAWQMLDGQTCPHDGGLFNRVERAVVIAWTDGREYPAGTLTDVDGIPITDGGIRDRKAPHAWVTEACAEAKIGLTEFCRRLVAEHIARTSLRAMSVVADPTEDFATQAKVRLFLRAAPPPSGGGGSSAPTTRGGSIGRRLTGAECQAFGSVLCAAFPSRDKMGMMLRFGMGENLEAIAGGGNLRETVTDVITWAESHGRVGELITAARSQNAGNRELAAFAAKFEAPSPVDLRAILAHYYPTASDARRVAESAGLALSRIDFGGASEAVWFSVLAEASKARLTNDVVAVLRHEYPTCGL